MTLQVSFSDTVRVNITALMVTQLHITGIYQNRKPGLRTGISLTKNQQFTP